MPHPSRSAPSMVGRTIALALALLALAAPKSSCAFPTDAADARDLGAAGALHALAIDGRGGPSGVGATSVAYIAPVDAPVTDPFRPPTGPYAPGNRGIEYATVPGSEVVAAADGVVTFAGTVAGSLFVTVLHADGIRTTVSYVSTVRVVAGQRVRQGDVLGTAGPVTHVSARRGDVYLDPATLWGSGPPRVFLVPLDGGSATVGDPGSGSATIPRWLGTPVGSPQPHSPGSTLGRHRRRTRASSNRREGSVA